MGITKRAQYKVFNGTDFDVINFESEADNQGIYRQLLINGNFDVWQRGTNLNINTSSTSVTYLADRWANKIYTGTNGSSAVPTVTVSRIGLPPTDVPKSTYAHRIVTTGNISTLSADGFCYLSQLIESGLRYIGNTNKLTVSFWARSSIANKVLGVGMVRDFGSGGSPSSPDFFGNYVTLTSAWAKYTVTLDVPSLASKTFGTNNNDRLILYLEYAFGNTEASTYGYSGSQNLGSGTLDITQVQINVGATALPFCPRTIGEEIALCQRYYETSYALLVPPGTANFPTGQHTTQGTSRPYDFADPTIYYKVTKRIKPTITIYNPMTGEQGGFRGADNTQNMPVGMMYTSATECTADKGYFYCGNGGLANGQIYSWHWVADAEY